MLNKVVITECWEKNYSEITTTHQPEELKLKNKLQQKYFEVSSVIKDAEHLELGNTGGGIVNQHNCCGRLVVLC